MPTPPRPRGRPAVRFGLHYPEMVAVMATGMGVFFGVLVLGAAALGYEMLPAMFGAMLLHRGEHLHRR